MTNKEAIEILLTADFPEHYSIREVKQTLNMAIKALEQEPFINKPCVAHKVCHEDKIKVLDRIRDEIKGMTPTYHNLDWSITDLVPISEVLKLVDKYKAESEE